MFSWIRGGACPSDVTGGGGAYPSDVTGGAGLTLSDVTPESRVLRGSDVLKTVSLQAASDPSVAAPEAPDGGHRPGRAEGRGGPPALAPRHAPPGGAAPPRVPHQVRRRTRYVPGALLEVGPASGRRASSGPTAGGGRLPLLAYSRFGLFVWVEADISCKIEC